MDLFVVIAELERENPVEAGVSMEEVCARLEVDSNDGQTKAMGRDEIKRLAAEALRLGFLSPIASDSDGEASRFVMTEILRDFLLFCGGCITFEEFVRAARWDGRFNDFFKQIDAEKS
jgi:hypothetical protein